jgi:monoamine oxidase
MATPVLDTLYFAGEHTDLTGHWGTVHAALRSGVRAARQVLAAVKTEWLDTPVMRGIGVAP